jgi:hypothetical protein
VAPTTRRKTLAAGLLAAVTLRQGHPAEGKSSCGKKASKRVDKTCARMGDECLTYYTSRCAESSNPEACLADVTACCGQLEACDFMEHITCLNRPR